MKRNINDEKGCFITNERYITAQMFTPRRYEHEFELNSSVKPGKKKHPNACFVLKRVIIKKIKKCITGRCIEIVSSGLSVKLVVVYLLVVKCEKRNSKIILEGIIQCILKRGVNIICSRKS